MVYLGDPVSHHAKYIVICLDNPLEVDKEMRIQDVVARSRLGNCVKKIIIFSWLEGTCLKYKSLRRGD